MSDALRDDGHAVVTPDLFDGDTFDDIDAGVARVDSSGGPPAFLADALAQTAHLEGPRVHAGFSLGAAVAAFLALAGDACEEFVYPGDGHLFAFEGWREYDADAAERMFDHVTDFLAELDNGE